MKVQHTEYKQILQTIVTATTTTTTTTTRYIQYILLQSSYNKTTWPHLNETSQTYITSSQMIQTIITIKHYPPVKLNMHVLSANLLLSLHTCSTDSDVSALLLLQNSPQYT